MWGNKMLIRGLHCRSALLLIITTIIIVSIIIIIISVIVRLIGHTETYTVND